MVATFRAPGDAGSPGPTPVAGEAHLPGRQPMVVAQLGADGADLPHLGGAEGRGRRSLRVDRADGGDQAGPLAGRIPTAEHPTDGRVGSHRQTDGVSRIDGLDDDVDAVVGRQLLEDRADRR